MYELNYKLYYYYYYKNMWISSTKTMQVLVFPSSISKEEFKILSSAANDEYNSWAVSFIIFYLTF